MERFLVFILLIFFASHFGYSQNVDRLLKDAQRSFYSEFFDQALIDYNKVLAADPKNRLAKYRTEICSLITKYRNNDIDRLLAYKSTQGKKDKFYFYWLGLAYFGQNQFKKAVESWEKFLALDKYKSKIIIAETKDYIKWAKTAEEQFSHPANYEIDQLSTTVNSEFTEYSPVYFKEKDELLFLSSRESGAKKEEFQVYQSFREGDHWKEPELISILGKYEINNANIEVVNNDGRLFVYKGGKYGDLYYSELRNGKWVALKKFDPQIAHSKLESHFFINEKEDRVLFAHRGKTKGHSDMDIYESFRDPSSGKWTQPKLFSEMIQSSEDEDFPFLTADEKTLYFCSRGFESIGAYDVFRSDFNETTQTWSKPEPMRYPVNTPDDDIQFKIDQETNTGYFVSDRFGTNGSYDIFFFHPSTKVLMSGVVIDATGAPVDHARIEFTPTRSTGLLIKTMTDESGQYKVRVGQSDQIKINIYFHEELAHSETFSSPAVQPGESIKKVVKDFNLFGERELLVEDAEHHDDPTYTDLEIIGSKFRGSKKALLKNIYFDFDQYYLDWADRPKLEPLVQQMKANPELKIEVAGHTDAIGDGMENLRISILRARSVARYLFEQGIETDRVIAKGYGYAIPMASNDQDKEGREFNRRIEIVVLE